MLVFINRSSKPYKDHGALCQISRAKRQAKQVGLVQPIVRRNTGAGISQKKLTFLNHLACKILSPGSICFSTPGTPHGACKSNFQILGRLILKINSYVVKNKLFP